MTTALQFGYYVTDNRIVFILPFRFAVSEDGKDCPSEQPGQGNGNTPPPVISALREHKGGKLCSLLGQATDEGKVWRECPPEEASSSLSADLYPVAQNVLFGSRKEKEFTGWWPFELENETLHRLKDLRIQGLDLANQFPECPGASNGHGTRSAHGHYPDR